MQDQNQTQSEFIARTDRLSRHLGITLRELAKQVGISPAMMFAYRSGKSPISPKALRKVSDAERAAGDCETQQMAVQETTSEEGTPYAALSVNALRRRFEDLLWAAKNDPVRLAWITEQMRAHLAIPKHWVTNEEINQRARELVAARAAERDREYRERFPQPQHSQKTA